MVPSFPTAYAFWSEVPQTPSKLGPTVLLGGGVVELGGAGAAVVVGAAATDLVGAGVLVAGGAGVVVRPVGGVGDVEGWPQLTARKATPNSAPTTPHTISFLDMDSSAQRISLTGNH